MAQSGEAVVVVREAGEAHADVEHESFYLVLDHQPMVRLVSGRPM